MPISNRLAELRDPIRFMEKRLINAEDNRPFRLYAEQKAFLRHAFEFDAEGRMKHTELCFSSGKKGGKTGLAGMICIFTAVVLAGQGGEIYCLANDFEQSSSRVFKAVVQILQASPLLRDSVDITANKVTFRSTGTTIIAVANDFAGFSGANPVLNVFDELAYFNSESSRRLFHEAVPLQRADFFQAKRLNGRIRRQTFTPAQLVRSRNRARRRNLPDLRVHENLLCYWTHEARAPGRPSAGSTRCAERTRVGRRNSSA